MPLANRMKRVCSDCRSRCADEADIGERIFDNVEGSSDRISLKYQQNNPPVLNWPLFSTSQVVRQSPRRGVQGLGLRVFDYRAWGCGLVNLVLS